MMRFVVFGDKQNSVLVRNQSKMSLTQEDPGLKLPNLKLIRYSPILRKMHISLSDSWHKLGFSICPLHSEENS